MSKKNKINDALNEKSVRFETKNETRDSIPIRFRRDENGTIGVSISVTPQEKMTKCDATLFKDKLTEICGTKDPELASNILDAVGGTISPIVGREQSLNLVAQSIYDLQPRDATEARLGAQATTLFIHAMASLNKAANSETLMHVESWTNLAIKLMRVHNETVTTIDRRRGAKQEIIVKHAVLANQVNFNNQVGGPPNFEGDTPCSRDYAMQGLEQTTIKDVGNRQWPENLNAGCMEGKAVDLKQKMGGSELN